MSEGPADAAAARGGAATGAPHAGRRRGDLAVSAAVTALGLFLLAGVRDINPGVGYDRIGPRFFPGLVAIGLIASGLLLALLTLRSRKVFRVARSGQGARAINPKTLFYLGPALLVFPLLLDRAGFVVAASLQFWLVARGFHSRRPLRDALAAVLVAVSIYLAFARGLGLTLPPGPLDWL